MPKVVQTAGRDRLGDFAPLFAECNDDILFGRVWSDDTIDMKTKSTIVISVFMGRGLADSSLKYHLMTAKKNGITKDEIAAIITHAAFYAGWPVGWAVFNMAKEVWADEIAASANSSVKQSGADCSEAIAKQSDAGCNRTANTATDADSEYIAGMEEHAKSMIFPVGAPNDAYAKYFSGRSYLAPISTEQVFVANVTFEPGCRNNWHIHHATSGGGQTLICVAGRGWYQEEGKEPVELVPGKVVNIPANVKHWHGAADDSWMSHLAIEVAGENTSNEWLEPSV